ncbi:10680_t:CDS:1 [Funneliformis geosporum]|uniref:10081_t:CDS:1 n=1 Tax=Funneliformis geosporum TaxID=1117311 RepID=A0A9W4ST32_9GLOM|nr:10081_t:CDS:1 [Funneliformis geosporum]CAI2182489.1 10680_t:CDS:1 [Funneliformis geosporum]
MYSCGCYNGQIPSNGKVTQANLDLRGKLFFVVVRLENGVQIDLPVPTIQEISERFFFRRAKTRPDKPARPPNKFFIFRTMFQVAIDNFKLQVPIVSSLASEVWRKCTPEVIEIFTKLSNIAKMEHGKINPGYVYKPNKTKSHCKINQNQQNTLIYPLRKPIMDVSQCSTITPIRTAPPRTTNSYSSTLALQTNSSTAANNFQAIYPSQYQSIYYMSSIGTK